MLIRAEHLGYAVQLAGSSTDLRVALSDSSVGLSLFWADDVGFPSVCYEYVVLPLVNKESALTNGLAE